VPGYSHAGAFRGSGGLGCGGRRLIFSGHNEEEARRSGLWGIRIPGARTPFLRTFGAHPPVLTNRRASERRTFGLSHSAPFGAQTPAVPAVVPRTERCISSVPPERRRSKTFSLLLLLPFGQSHIATHCPPPQGGGRSAKRGRWGGEENHRAIFERWRQGRGRAPSHLAVLKLASLALPVSPTPNGDIPLKSVPDATKENRQVRSPHGPLHGVFPRIDHFVATHPKNLPYIVIIGANPFVSYKNPLARRCASKGPAYIFHPGRKIPTHRYATKTQEKESVPPESGGSAVHS
jgi:hypothetical protein